MSSINVTALLDYLREFSAGLNWRQRITLLGEFSNRSIVFSTSFSLEDQVITEVIASEKLPVHCFTLDTGRLFEETHDVQQQTIQKYDLKIESYFPDPTAVESYVASDGMNGFYDSVESRKRCCHIRKVEPLGRALEGAEIWVSGVRAEHSEYRQSLSPVEWDAAHQVIKYYPLLDTSLEDIRTYIEKHDIPYNALHDKGYPSIGCQPCTRAVLPGESARAGRWWWEDEATSECGLHLVDGKLVPTKSIGLEHAE